MDLPKGRNIFYRILWIAGNSPGLFLRPFLSGVLFVVLAQTLVGFGGFLPYGEPMIGVSKTLILLAVVYAITFLTEKNRQRPGWELLLPLPFLAYACIHYLFISSSPVEAGGRLAVFVQAYTIYFITCTSIHGRRSRTWFVWILQGFVLLVLVGALYQHYLAPDWMLYPDRIRFPAYQVGAAGFLQDPANVGIFLLSILPVSALLAIKHYRSGTVWIWQSLFCLVLLVGFLLSSSRIGLIAMGFVLATLPFTGAQVIRTRLHVARNILLALLFIGVFGWYLTEALNQRIQYFLAGPADEAGQLSLEIAVAQFQAQPIWGQGLGTFASNWDAFAPRFVAEASEYPVSTYWDLLSELGILGFVLAALPAAILLAGSWKLWRSIPFRKFSQQDLEQIRRLPPKHPSRDSLRRRLGRIPSLKVLLGGLVSGLIGLCIYAYADYGLLLPVGLFYLACFGGLLAAIVKGHERTPIKGYGLIATALVPLVLSVWAAAFGIPRFYAAHLIYTGNEELAQFAANPEIVFKDPGAVYLTEEAFVKAAELMPESGAAWLGQGRARLTLLDAYLQDSKSLAAQALASLEKAQSVEPGVWLTEFELGRSKAILGRSLDEVEGHLRAAMDLAPSRPEPVALLGSLLLERTPSSDTGLALLNKGLSLMPDYEPAVKALRSHSVLAQDLSTEHARTEAVIAEQFTVVPLLSDRVMGAGMLPAPEGLNPTPDL